MINRADFDNKIVTNNVYFVDGVSIDMKTNVSTNKVEFEVTIGDDVAKVPHFTNAVQIVNSHFAAQK